MGNRGLRLKKGVSHVSWGLKMIPVHETALPASSSPHVGSVP